MKKAAVLVLVVCAALAAAQKPLAKAKTPSRVDAIMDLANDRMATQIDVAFDDGDFPAVISFLRLQAEQYPADYEVWTNLGWMQENVEAYDAALATYVRYRRQNPQEPDAAYPEANFYAMKKLYAKVPPLLEPAIKNPKVHANLYRTLARAYDKLGMLTDAARVYRALTVRDPKDGAAKVNLKRVEGKIKGNKRQGTGK